jgi:hypothetical protein
MTIIPEAVMPRWSLSGRTPAQSADFANAGGFQIFDHALNLRAQHHRIPQRIGAGGKAFVAFVDTGHDRLVVAFNFVRRVDKNQAATGNRRQLRFQLLVAIGFSTRARASF